MKEDKNNRVDEKASSKGLLTSDDAIARKKKIKKIALKTVLAIAVVSLAAFVIHYISPEQQVRRSFKKGIAAFEKMSPRETSDCFSDRFTNPLIPDKAAFESMLSMVYGQFKSVKVHLSEMTVEVADGSHAKVIVKGSIYFKDAEDKLYRAKNENPVTFKYEKEKNGWKILSVEGMDLDLMSAAKEEIM